MDLKALIAEAKQESANAANEPGNTMVHHWLFLVLENKLPRNCLYGINMSPEEQSLWNEMAAVIRGLPKEDLDGDIHWFSFQMKTDMSYVGWAARNEYRALLEVLLVAGADPNGLFNGKPAIWQAVFYVCPPVCLELLINHGAKCPRFMLGDQELKFDLRWLFHGFRGKTVPKLKEILNKNVEEFERRTWKEQAAMEAQYYEAKFVQLV
jgi:hypothetical protein